MLKLNRKATLKEIISSSLLAGAILLSLFGIASAITNYPPGALLQPNDVTSSHIRDNTITNADISASAAIEASKTKIGNADGTIAFAGTGGTATSTDLTFSTSTRALTTGDLVVSQGTTTIRSVKYIWPSADGTANQALSTNGSGTLSWATVGSQATTESNTLQLSADTENTSTAASYTKVKEIQVYYPGKVRVKFDIRCSAGGTDAAGQVYLNGTVQSSFGLESTCTYVTRSQDIVVGTGDKLQLYVYRAAGAGSVYYRNFRVYYDRAATSTEGYIRLN